MTLKKLLKTVDPKNSHHKEQFFFAMLFFLLYVRMKS